MNGRRNSRWSEQSPNRSRLVTPCISRPSSVVWPFSKAAGEEPSAIKQWLVDRYGDWVTYNPPVSGTTWPLWGLPIILLLIGGAIAARRLRRRR